MYASVEGHRCNSLMPSLCDRAHILFGFDVSELAFFRRISNTLAVRTSYLGVLLIWLAGCTSPGAPTIVDSPKKAGGPYAYNCKNVSKEHEVSRYVTAYYMTTYGSVYKEGPLGSLINANTETIIASSDLSALMPEDNTYCMSFDREFAEVVRAVAKALPRLRIAVEIKEVSKGEFVTAFAKRQHTKGLSAKSPAKWRVRYLIKVTDSVTGATDVRVYREIYISRPLRMLSEEYKSRGGYSRYNKAVSNGHNEAWFLWQVKQRL